MRSNVLAALVAVLAFAAALVAGARLHLELPVGRRATGDLIERALASEISGAVRIGAVERASPDRVVARDVAFFSPEGEEVMRFGWAELEPDLGRLLRERCIATRRARVRGVELKMIERAGEDGLGLERAFESRHRGGGGGGVRIDFANVAFSGLDSEWRFPGAPAFHLDDASGLARIRTHEDGGVVMRFDRVEADARSAGLPIDASAEITRASGGLHTGHRRLGRFSIALEVADSPVDVDLRLIDGEGGVRVRARTETEPGSLGWLATMGADIATAVAGDSDAVETADRDRDEDRDEDEDEAK